MGTIVFILLLQVFDVLGRPRACISYIGMLLLEFSMLIAQMLQMPFFVLKLILCFSEGLFGLLQFLFSVCQL